MIIGADISLNHAGFCFLSSPGEIEDALDYCFFTNVKKHCKLDPEHGIYLDFKKQKGEYNFSYELRRIGIYEEFFIVNVVNKVRTFPRFNYFSFEGYSFLSSTNSICQLAELMGLIKQRVYNDNFYLRCHDPMTVKLFAVGKGDALKKDMVEEARKKIKIPESLIRIVKKKVGGNVVEEYDGPGTDIADAYFLAKMMYYELQLREGSISLKDLPEHQIRVFNRVTKAYPENLLSRPLILKKD